MEFSVLPGKVQKNARELSCIKSDLNRMRLDVNSVQAKVGRQFQRYPEVGRSLRVASGQLEDAGNSMQSLSDSLDSIAKLYEKTEKTIKKSTAGWTFDVEEKESAWNKKTVTRTKARYDNGDGSIIRILTATSAFEASGQSPKYKDKDGLYKYDCDEQGKVLHDKEWVKDKNGRLSDPSKTEYAKQKVTILEGKAEKKWEGSIFNYFTGDDDTNASIDIGKAEAHGSISGGLYGYDKDGKKVFAPGVAAEIAASVCVLTAQANGKLGNDMFGVKGHGEINVGKASVEGSAKAAFFGKNGELNPQVKVSGSAEALVAEAKGSASLTVAGVEGTVNGSVNFGVGAHADIGIVDGKIKCDIGASLGIGASVGFEIDTKPLVNAVSSQAKAMWNMFTGS